MQAKEVHSFLFPDAAYTTKELVGALRRIVMEYMTSSSEQIYNQL